MRRVIVLAVGAASLLAIGLGTGFIGGDDNAPQSAPPAPAVTETPTPPPAPRPTAAVEVPTASASLATLQASAAPPPTRVSIGELGIDMAIVPVGVKADREMQIPDDPSVAGWYQWGSAPATGAGSTVVAAHVDSLRYGLGPFAALRTLSPGAEVAVAAADGSERRYAVQSLSYYAKADLPAAELFTRTGEERLVLITCGGAFDRDALSYSDNVIVIATPIP